jgi:hypothetical protein
MVGRREALGLLPDSWKGHSTISDIQKVDVFYDQSRPANNERTLGTKLACMRPDISETERKLALAILQKYFVMSRNIVLLPCSCWRTHHSKF